MIKSIVSKLSILVILTFIQAKPMEFRTRRKQPSKPIKLNFHPEPVTIHNATKRRLTKNTEELSTAQKIDLSDSPELTTANLLEAFPANKNLRYLSLDNCPEIRTQGENWDKFIAKLSLQLTTKDIPIIIKISAATTIKLFKVSTDWLIEN